MRCRHFNKTLKSSMAALPALYNDPKVVCESGRLLPVTGDAVSTGFPGFHGDGDHMDQQHLGGHMSDQKNHIGIMV